MDRPTRMIPALKRVGPVLLSVGLLAGLTAFTQPWLPFGGELYGPWSVRKAVILTSLFGGLPLALLAVGLAIYYALTGGKGGWWLASVALTVVVSFAGYLILQTLFG